MQPTGVAADGTVVGSARYRVGGKDRFSVVRWTADGHHAHALATVVGIDPSPVVDADGDIAYYASPSESVVRTPAGVVRPLRGSDGTAYNLGVLRGGDGHVIYGYDNTAQTRWTIAPDGTSAADDYATRSWVNFLSAANAGTLVVNDTSTRTRDVAAMHLITRGGAYVTVGNVLGSSSGSPAGHAVNEHGTVAFTSSKDRRVHFAACR